MISITTDIILGSLIFIGGLAILMIALRLVHWLAFERGNYLIVARHIDRKRCDV